MKTKQFNTVAKYMLNADKDDAIWYCGFLLLQMTEKQLDKLYDLLKDRFPEEVKTYNNVTVKQITLPSGIGINNPYETKVKF